MNSKGGGTHKLTVIPNLKKRMETLGVHIAPLASKAGVGVNTVLRARKGLPIHLFIVDCIVVALETNQ